MSGVKKYMGEENKKEWYSNKDLFEMLQGLKKDLQETRTVIKKYNGLRKDLGETMLKLAEIENQMRGRNQVWEGIRNWGGWIVALTTLLLKGVGIM